MKEIRIMNQELDIKRIEVTRVLAGRDEGFVAIVGPCANQKNRKVIHEGTQLAKLAKDGLVTVHRVPTWKPRTPRKDGTMPWQGLEHRNPTGALSRVLWECRKNIPVALEIKDRAMAIKYGHLATMMWLGARSSGNAQLDQTMTRADMSMVPLGIKNDLSGNIDSALERIRGIRKGRTHKVGMPAVVSLIFRGGTDMQTPDAWEESYKRAMHATEGRMIVDVAHGGEMAHDPSGAFRKTVLGQMTCLDHVVSLAQKGLVPAGIMIEASDITIPEPYLRTDPNMPFSTALEAVSELYALAMKGVRV
jgi:phospho-2-dehydro-3-deoxyheptonate aldolase